MLFEKFVGIFRENFAKLTKQHNLAYKSSVLGSQIWDMYLISFPEEERQSFNCNACKSFICQYGNIVFINKDLTLNSIWNFEVNDSMYQKVLNNLHEYVTSLTICSVFKLDNEKLGTYKNFDLKRDKYWYHFSINLCDINATRIFNSPNYNTVVSELNGKHGVIKRGLEEITVEAVETVLELIADNNLYRGAEFKAFLHAFLKMKQAYVNLAEDDKDNYCWLQVNNRTGAIKNTVIGTLLQDLSEGKNEEKAIKSYENKIAPANYKRPKALITNSTLKKVKETIEKLNLIDSLERRLAVSDDLDINNLIYVDRDVNNNVDIFQELEKDVAVNPKTFEKKAIKANIQDFIKNVVPIASSIRVLFENRHQSNLFSLLTAVNKESEGLFKWNNNFSWSYNNAVADSIKEKVKKAGGKVDGKLRISLSWYNTDDYDLYLYEPDTNVIYYNKPRSQTGGHLDIDMNVSNPVCNAVENIIYSYSSEPIFGEYIVEVNNYTLRNHNDYGFEVEIAASGQLYKFVYSNFIPQGNTVSAVKFLYDRQGNIEIISDNCENSLTASTKVWALNTNKFHKVTNIFYSPNYWGYDLGNKHVFFTLENAINDGIVRPFFNEFLRPDLEQHHKRAFEVMANKLKVEKSDKELSGLGFSTTISNNFIAEVKTNQGIKYYNVTI